MEQGNNMENIDMDILIKKAGILIEALPYIQTLYGKTVVIKYGGNAMINESLKLSVMEDILLLKYVGVKPIIIHGGGPDITDALNSFGVKSRFVSGLRVTDAETMRIAQMVLVGKTNKEIVALLNNKGGNAVGICGIDGNLIECEQYFPEENGDAVDIGSVGKITNINSKLLSVLAEGTYLPVIAPIGVGEDGESYNINADTVAGEIASALKAEKMMLLTDVEGVKTTVKTEAGLEVEEIAPALTVKEVHKMIETNVISGGMIPKVLGCVEAVNRGVGRTHIIDGRIPHCILLEIFTDRGIGTMIMK